MEIETIIVNTLVSAMLFSVAVTLVWAFFSE